VEKQKGQVLVVGVSCGASAFLFNRFIWRIIRKTAKATIRKLIIVLMKTPIFSVTAPAPLAAAREEQIP